MDQDEDERWEGWLESEHDRDEEDSAVGATDYDDAPAEEGDDDEDEIDEPVAQAPPPSSPGEPPCTLVVRQGDCVLSIARRYRSSVEEIWSAPQNAGLRKAREKNQLLAGDALFIPARKARHVPAQTGRLHRFQVERPNCTVTLRLLAGGRPRAGLPYRLEIDGLVRDGETDGDGRLTERVPREARAGTLTLTTATGEERYPIRVGHLDPIVEVSGIQERLNHLGFGCGPVDGKPSARFHAALAAFQMARGLSPTGEADGPTREALKTAHGS